MNSTIGQRLTDAGGQGPDEQLALAAHGFAETHPELSARPRGPRRSRQVVVAAVLLVAIGLTVLRPGLVLAGSLGIFVLLHCATTLHRLELIRRAVHDDPTLAVTDVEARAVPDAELPRYTVLVPAYREPAVIASVVAGMSALDYPHDRLEVLLLLEADDEETIAAARSALGGDRSGPTRIVEVPPGEPRTKPKACNLGLIRSSGEFVTIFDAEDRPEPLQLRRAVVAFRRVGVRVACLQARLSYHNAEQNILTRWFTVEYDTWFRWLLPGLMATGAPIPLGGTSNHIRRDALVAVGAWDPWNVTEDADLGLRLARCGYRVAMLGSTTEEEANSDAINWVKQRSRWYKGYLQSFLVHARHPVALTRQVGVRGVVGMVLFVAATPVLAAVNPLFWALTGLWIVAHPSAVAALFPPLVYYPGLAVWMLGGFAAVIAGVANVRAAGKPHLAGAALISPLYWVLMSLAAIKAVVQLVTQPSYWEKTTHGLDTTDRELDADTPERPGAMA
ncbi:glycosyltransferase family 2 protein [Actinomycetospora chiangmaiensis]|uniref:glycosyltransferase family 2 protein n=1 Tax=Actinomycetospora chiangmaiensis TaxID=402650 RepID=UPI00039E0CDE|nr:glycosyltransferase [Actinomycetospora chiangmaiensis]